MENDNNMSELEQMREQMNIFKSSIDKQQIINEDLVRTSMGSQMSWINNIVWGEMVLVPIMLVIMAFYHAGMGLSWWLYAFLAAGLIADVIGDYIINRIPKSQLLSGDLVATSQRLVKMKKQRTNWFVAGVIFCTIWLVWFIIELVMREKLCCSGQDHNMMVGVLIGAIVLGALIGFFVSWLIFRKMQKTNNQIIEQISQITKED